MRHNGVTGKSYSPTAIDAYTSLATKLLQMNPAATLPVAAPTGAFTGDSITVTATGGTGTVTFTASGANAANVKTELLVQPLKSKNRAPAAKGYRSKGFVAFAAGSRTFVRAGLKPRVRMRAEACAPSWVSSSPVKTSAVVEA